MLYPLFFKPDYKERVWGGRKLEQKLGKNIPFDHTGESWEVASHDNGNSIISNGELKGKKLSDIFKNNKEDLLGVSYMHMKKFPLLIKFIDAKEKLSVQVHPEDDYAHRVENGELGKSETWYILDAIPGSKLIVGLKDSITKQDFKNALDEEHLEDVLNEIEVKNGDVINIPAGLIHAIQGGILLAEIQQNSDTTYRVYDWNRVGLDGDRRALHIDKSLDVIDFEGKHSKQSTAGLSIKNGENETIYYVANKYFALEELLVNDIVTYNTRGEKFYIYICVSGNGKLKWYNKTVDFKLGDSFLIPACLGDYELEGKAKLIRSYIPDIDEDVIKPLKEHGFSEAEINNNVSIS